MSRLITSLMWAALIATFVLNAAWLPAQDSPSPPQQELSTFDGTATPARPTEFANVFALPYAISDEYPQDPAEFERMLTLLKSAGFNTVYCPFTEWRHELFKKHGMKMMIDVLIWKGPVQNDIRKEDQRVRLEEICKQVKGSDAVWGYNLWNERLDFMGPASGVDTYISLIRSWDDTHPIWVGTYRNYFADSYKFKPGMNSWYDYHWERGLHWNFSNLKYYRDLSMKRESAMGRWLGIDGWDKDLYTLNTSIAYGLKAGMWFIGGPYKAREPDLQKRWDPDSHLIRLGQHLRPRYQLIGEMGPAVEVYCTPTTRTPDNKEKESGIPDSATPFPEEHWFRVAQGEAVVGFFDHPDGSEIAYVASLRAFEPQDLHFEFHPEAGVTRQVEVLDLATGNWTPIASHQEYKTTVPNAEAVILRFRVEEK
ncbi:hypothetical protein SH668x_000217 [Planctomicrobium sp. SH668]|uniref:hypothetical protein n=1 Tax=Planctomicrobium sp. SH668 TaxID=3448126 RepID=UPI003F5B2EE2